MSKPIVKVYSPKATPEQFLFSDVLSDLPLNVKKPERNLEAELFGDKQVTKVIDEFEKSIGFREPEKPKQNVKWRNIVLCPEDANDRITLNDLMNDKEKYTIIKWSEAWTARSQYKVFIIFTENLADDLKPKEEPKE